jgi:hypothetical protein
VIVKVDSVEEVDKCDGTAGPVVVIAVPGEPPLADETTTPATIANRREMPATRYFIMYCIQFRHIWLWLTM